MSRERPVERMEREAERLEEQGDRVDQRIDDVRQDWEGKEHDSSVPGAQRQESDQLPEEPDDE